ncbi:MAG: hypothetical protein CMH25_01325 [Micavibrio sp.]|nr:hypothetical protein [Micavibrio sp.]|tara:strand:+ start:265856 stop:267766 length:1911 start_codon:yes stop_codon:yes gene_type:complete
MINFGKSKDCKAFKAMSFFAIVFLLFIFASSPSHALVNGACGPSNGGKFRTMPTQPAEKCARGLDTTTTQSGTNWRWTCTGSGGGTTATCTAAQCGSVAGDCKTFSGYFAAQPASSTANACNIGDYADTADTATLWQWNCAGRGTPAGATDACTANRATTENGACKAISGYYASEPATNTANACNAGTFVDLSDTGTQWQWRCNGAGTPVGTNSPTCTANRATTENGACKAISGNYASQPATNTASGCDAGSYVDLADSGTQWQWRCNGTGTPTGTNSPTCSANKATTVNGACKPISGYYGSQPATNTSNGCNAGSYVDLADSGTKWQWRCNGTGTPTGTNSVTCQADKATTIDGACKPISGYHATQPATDSASGCNQGNFFELADNGTTWNWRCNGAGTPTGTNSGTCTAQRRTTFNGSCGAAAGGTYSSPPSTSLCSSGQSTTVTLSGSTYNWSCNGGGQPAGTNAPCTATKAASCPDGPTGPAVNATCGVHHNETFTSTPSGSTSLCQTGTASAVSLTGSTYTWTCSGISGGTNDSCSAMKKAVTGCTMRHPVVWSVPGGMSGARQCAEYFRSASQTGPFEETNHAYGSSGMLVSGYCASGGASGCHGTVDWTCNSDGSFTFTNKICNTGDWP